MARRRSRLRTFFVRGLAGLLPTLLTAFALIYIVQFLDGYLGELITNYPVRAVGSAFADWLQAHRGVRLVFTIAVSVAAVLVVGSFLTSFTGYRIYRYFEKFLFDIPIVKKIYPSARQLTDFLFSEKPMEWSAVVAVQYPRAGMYSLGFLMADAPGELSTAVGTKLLAVYMPTSPVPFTGYVVCVPDAEVIRLRITVEEALRWIVSAGVVLPGAPPPGAGGMLPPPRRSPG